MAHSDLVQSVVRSLDILERVARSEEGLTLPELADLLAVQPSTAYNLARTLLARGFLEKGSRPTRYRLGPSLLELADAHRSHSLLQRAAAAIPALFRQLRHATVTFAQAVGGEVMITLRMDPERPGLLQRPQARSMHPYGSVSALVFQAYWSAEERTAYRRRHPFWETGGHRWESPERLDAFLQEIRRGGCAAIQFPDDPFFKVAAPITGPHGELLATLGASIPARCMTEENRQESSDLVLRLAGRLSQGNE